MPSDSKTLLLKKANLLLNDLNIRTTECTRSGSWRFL